MEGSMEERMEKLVEAVRQHALAHYEEGGWDLVIECWERAEIAKEIAAAKDEAHAIRIMRKRIKPLADYRADIEATAF
jgi:hypothetical protein